MKRQGHSLIELVAGLLILVPVVLLLSDLVILTIATQINDNTCQEAARLAATGDPTSVNARAMSVIDAANNSRPGIISDVRLLDVKLDPANLIAQAAALPHGGSLMGSVTVETSANIHTFLVSQVFMANRPIICSSSKTFPFTYVVPNTSIPSGDSTNGSNQ